jgi:dTDP-4-dehydrorhamnose 3,5-epimerase
MAFSFKRMEIPEVVLVEPKVFPDTRGFFLETYKEFEFIEFGLTARFVQDNHSLSFRKHTVRGMHFQKLPRPQVKLVRVIRGSILDVAVDIRKNSPTYRKWVSAVLSAENKAMLYIPEGFAHGFCTLDDNTEIVYKCSDVYSPECDRGFSWSDPDVAIAWPLAKDEKPVLSPRDNDLLPLGVVDNNF